MYELSADVCSAAGNYPELLKSIQTLVTELYPNNSRRAAAEVQAQGQAQLELQPRGKQVGSTQEGPEGEASSCRSGGEGRDFPSSSRTDSACDAASPQTGLPLQNSAIGSLTTALANGEDGDCLTSSAPQLALDPTSSLCEPAASAAAQSEAGWARDCLGHGLGVGRLSGDHVHSSCSGSSREGEIHAAQLLFFACVPALPSKLDLVHIMRDMVGSPIWGSAPVQVGGLPGWLVVGLVQVCWLSDSRAPGPLVCGPSLYCPCPTPFYPRPLQPADGFPAPSSARCSLPRGAPLLCSALRPTPFPAHSCPMPCCPHLPPCIMSYEGGACTMSHGGGACIMTHES